MSCCIRSCPSKYGRSSVSFHQFPKHSEVRRQRWIEAAARGNEINYDYASICSRHFVGGRPAKAGDRDNVSWVPTLLLDGGLSAADAMNAKRRSAATAGVVDGGSIHDVDDLDVSCAVRGCGMTKEENPTLLFFPVPRNQNERRKWLLQIGMMDYADNAGRDKRLLAVCELHFDLTKDLLNYDDVISMGNTAMLKEHVMPSRNVPAVNPVHFTHEMPDSNSMTSMQEELPVPIYEDDDDDLLEEMPPRNGSEADDHAMPEFPTHMQPSPIEEFVQICRSCLSTDKSNLVSAFDDRLAEVFQQFTSVSINENEGISTLICGDCKSRLLEIHFFRDTCITNTQVLIHRYQKCYGMATDGDHNDHSLGAAYANVIPQITPTPSKYNHYGMGADDPEDLLMPQKEETEVDSYKPSKVGKPRGRPPKVAPPIVVAPPKKKKQQIATMHKKFKCKFCRKEYNSRPGYEMHMATHKYHQESEFTEECKRCDIRTRKGEVHRCYTDILYCYVCGEKYGKWGHLKLHLAKKHRIKTKRRELMQKLKEMGYVGGRVNALKVPPGARAPQKEESEEEESDDYESPLKTPVAQEKSDSSRSATSSPVDPQQQQRKCTFCGVGFAYNSSLEMHMKTHSPIELTQCNECDSNFDSYLELERHHDEHEDENPLSDEIICRLCGKQLLRQQTLVLHLQYVHKDKNVVQCSTCPYLCENALELTNHVCKPGPKKQSAAAKKQSASSSTAASTNGGFLIVKPESILKGASASAMSGDDSNSMPVGLQGTDGADPLLGLGNEDVIDLDDSDDDDHDESSQEKSNYDCSICGKQFDKEDVLERHMKLHRMMNVARSNEIGLRNSFSRAFNCRREVSQPI